MSKKPAVPQPIDIHAALTSARPVIDFVLPGLPVAAVGSIVGSGGVGKSFFALHLAIAVAAGQRWAYELLAGPGEKVVIPAPSKVALVLGEESREMAILRLHQIVDHHAATAGERRVLLDRLSANLKLYALAGGPRVVLDDFSEDVHGLDELAAMCAGTRLVILDPLRRFHVGEENDSLHMTRTVQACEGLGKRNKSAVLVTHHSTKQSAYTATAERSAASRGSTALTDGVRLQVNMSALDGAMAKTYRVADEQAARCVRLDIAKSNYVADGHRGVLRRTSEGVLDPVAAPESSLSAPYVVPVEKLKRTRKAKSV